MNLAAWLLTLVGPLAKQVMVALGFGVLVYTGVDAAVSGALGAAKNAWAGSLYGEVTAFMALAGVNTALGIVAGGITARISMMTFKKLIPK
ncbi:MAG: DUF2523 domain-containing protein [Oligoflexus sp.]